MTCEKRTILVTSIIEINIASDFQMICRWVTSRKRREFVGNNLENNLDKYRHQHTLSTFIGWLGWVHESADEVLVSVHWKRLCQEVGIDVSSFAIDYFEYALSDAVADPVITHVHGF